MHSIPLCVRQSPLLCRAPYHFAMRTVGERLRWAREQAGYETAADAARARGWHVQNVRDHEADRRGVKPELAIDYARAYGIDKTWLLYGGSNPKAKDTIDTVPIIGMVGADPSGRVLMTEGQMGQDSVPLPPGGTADAVALEVAGHSMRGVADDGGLVYFEDQRTPPSPDMLGHVVICQTEDGQVLMKRLLKGSERGLYDLESLAGPTLEDRRLAWAAHITAIVPPHQARRIIRRGIA